MSHCNLEEPYFSWLLAGEISVIGQVRKGRWDNLFVGDTLLVNRGLDGTQVEFVITNLVAATGFQELYMHCRGQLLPTLPTLAWDYYQQHFSREEEMCYGVIGIQVERKQL